MICGRYRRIFFLNVKVYFNSVLFSTVIGLANKTLCLICRRLWIQVLLFTCFSFCVRNRLGIDFWAAPRRSLPSEKPMTFLCALEKHLFADRWQKGNCGSKRQTCMILDIYTHIYIYIFLNHLKGALVFSSMDNSLRFDECPGRCIYCLVFLQGD